MYGKEEAAKFLGCKIKWFSRDMGDGSIAFHWNAGSMSMFYIFHANIEQNVNLPQFGGMNKVKFMETANGYDTDMESEKYGKLHIIEKYADDGVTIVSNCDLVRSIKNAFFNTESPRLFAGHYLQGQNSYRIFETSHQ